MQNRRDFFKTQQAKHWEEQVYKNPYFSEPKYSLKKVYLTIAIGTLALCILVGFLYAPFWRVNNYIVNGAEFMDSNAALVEVKDFIKKKKFLVIPRDHFLFLPKDELSQFLFERFQLNGLDLRREGHTVLITISEKICRAVWETDGKRYLMDETGTILSEIDSTEETGKLAIIKSVGNESVSAGQQVLTQGIVENILAFLFEIKKMPFELSSLEIDSTETSFLKLNMKDGYSVFFDPTSDMLPQLNRLVTVLKSESADTSTYEYIDVRFGERVYIKDRL